MREKHGNSSTIACSVCSMMWKAAALAVGDELVGAGADHQLALVRLADVAVHRVRHDHRVDARLDRLRDQRLQGEALDRQAEARHLREHARVAGGDQSQLVAGDGAARGLDARDPAALGADARDLAVLDDVDAAGVGGAGVAPGDRVVARGAAAALQRRPHDRVAGAPRDVEQRLDRVDLLRARGTRCRRRSGGWRGRAA